MLSWEPLEILSYGAETPSTTLVLMSCEDALEGRPIWSHVPVYSAVIFCDLHAEPPWGYRQVAFVATVCRQAGIPYFTLDSNLYGDFTRNFGYAHVLQMDELVESRKAKHENCQHQHMACLALAVSY